MTSNKSNYCLPPGVNSGPQKTTTKNKKQTNKITRWSVESETVQYNNNKNCRTYTRVESTVQQ